MKYDNNLRINSSNRTLTILPRFGYVDDNLMINIPFIGYEYLPVDFEIAFIPPNIRIPREDLRDINVMRYLLKRKRIIGEETTRLLGKNVGG